MSSRSSGAKTYVDVNEELLEKYIDHLLARNKSIKTIRTFRSIIRRFLRYLNGKDVRRVTIQDIDGFLAYLRRNGYSEKSLYTAAVAIKRFLEYHEITEPLKKFEYPRRPKALPRFLTYEEVLKLLEATESLEDKLIILLLYSTGIRVSELVNIKIKDIDLRDRSIRVYGKGGKEREVFFNKETGRLLKRMIKGRDQDEYLLKGRKGKLNYVTVERRLKRIALKAGLKKKVTPHILRHSFATFALSRGMDVREIQELLGHASLKTTQVYTHITRKRLKEDYESIWS